MKKIFIILFAVLLAVPVYSQGPAPNYWQYVSGYLRNKISPTIDSLIVTTSGKKILINGVAIKGDSLALITGADTTWIKSTGVTTNSTLSAPTVRATGSGVLSDTISGGTGGGLYLKPSNVASYIDIAGGSAGYIRIWDGGDLKWTISDSTITWAQANNRIISPKFYIYTQTVADSALKSKKYIDTHLGGDSLDVSGKTDGYYMKWDAANTVATWAAVPGADSSGSPDSLYISDGPSAGTQYGILSNKIVIREGTGIDITREDSTSYDCIRFNVSTSWLAAYLDSTSTNIQRADTATLADSVIGIDEANADKVGAMLTGNTETGITVTYQDADNTIDFVVSLGASIESAEITDQTIVKADIDTTIAMVFGSVYLGTSASTDSLLPTRRWVDSVATANGGGSSATAVFDTTTTQDSIFAAGSADTIIHLSRDAANDSTEISVDGKLGITADGGIEINGGAGNPQFTDTVNFTYPIYYSMSDSLDTTGVNVGYVKSLIDSLMAIRASTGIITGTNTKGFYLVPGTNLIFTVSDTTIDGKTYNRVLIDASGGGTGGIFTDSTTYYVNETARGFDFNLTDIDSARVQLRNSIMTVGTDTVWRRPIAGGSIYLGNTGNTIIDQHAYKYEAVSDSELITRTEAQALTLAGNYIEVDGDTATASSTFDWNGSVFNGSADFSFYTSAGATQRLMRWQHTSVSSHTFDTLAFFDASRTWAFSAPVRLTQLQIGTLSSATETWTSLDGFGLTAASNVLTVDTAGLNSSFKIATSSVADSAVGANRAWHLGAALITGAGTDSAYSGTAKIRFPRLYADTLRVGRIGNGRYRSIFFPTATLDAAYFRFDSTGTFQISNPLYLTNQAITGVSYITALYGNFVGGGATRIDTLRGGLTGGNVNRVYLMDTLYAGSNKIFGQDSALASEGEVKDSLANVHHIHREIWQFDRLYGQNAFRDSMYLTYPMIIANVPYWWTDSTSKGNDTDLVYATIAFTDTTDLDTIYIAYVTSSATADSSKIDSVEIFGNTRASATNSPDSLFSVSGTDRVSTSEAVAKYPLSATVYPGEFIMVKLYNALKEDDSYVRCFYISAGGSSR